MLAQPPKLGAVVLEQLLYHTALLSVLQKQTGRTTCVLNLLYAGKVVYYASKVNPLATAKEYNLRSDFVAGFTPFN